MIETYRSYYWKEAIRQIRTALSMIWHGVIRNEGHHSKWGRGWFYGNKK